MKNKKTLIYLLAALMVLIVFAVIGKNAGWFGKAHTFEVAVEYITQHTIIETIVANGKIQPETEVNISSDVSGEIVELNVIEGQEVTAGQLLVKIKPDLYQSALERVEASLNSTRSNYANAKARLSQTEAQFLLQKQSFERNKKLWEQKTISQAEYEQSLSSYQVAKAEVEAARQNVKASEYSVKSAEASLNEARENLRKTSIYAPISGTVSKLNVEKGERVVGTMQMTGTEILRIANLNMMEVEVDVNENDIIRVSPKDTALIEIDAYTDTKFKGIVTEVANSANTTGTSTDQVTNFKVKILILPASYRHLIPKNNPNFYPFRPGMSATVDIQTETRYNILAVPIQSVTTRAEADSTNQLAENTELEEQTDNQVKDENTLETKEAELKEVIFIEQDGKAQMVEVKTGIQDNNYIEITEGAEAGQKVITAPYNAISKKLKQGTAITVVEKTELFKAQKK